jgi:hypothetical protein
MRRLGLSCVLVAVFAGVVVRGSSIAGADPDAGWFSVHCKFSHARSDDPIKYPRDPGASHRHDFFGNVSTDAFSTFRSMVAARSNCGLSKDTAGYWAPSLIAPNGQPVEPSHFTAYFRNLPASGRVHAFPPNFRMIAGGDTHHPPRIGDHDAAIGYNCLDSEPYRARLPNCRLDPKGTWVKAHVTFPNCWDGRHLDSPDHMSHVVYPVQGKCPRGHRVRLPRLSIHITYPITNGKGYRLSSDLMGMRAGKSLHADFWNTWHQHRLRTLVQRCLAANVVCGEVTNAGINQ